LATEDAQSNVPRGGALLGGRYRVLAPCGSGAMGVVYEGRHEGLGRRVAIKCLHPHLAKSGDFAARFISEARLASSLAHPNIVRVYDFGTEQTSDGPLTYMVMEYCSGNPLGSVLQQGSPIPLSRVSSIMNQVLSALAEAHDHGIVHRDVKPDNVILETGSRGAEVAKLIDFGIAEVKAKGAQGDGTIAGTPGYLSPEVILGGTADHHADLYAAGAMLFELVTGTDLFDGDTVTEIFSKHLTAPRPDPRSVAPDRVIPEELAVLCRRSVAIDPSERFEDADAFADALASAVTSVPNRPLPPPSSPHSAPISPESESAARRQLESGPEIHSTSPAGRYLHREGEDRVSGVHPAKADAPMFWVLQDIELDATVAMTKRRWKEAAAKLKHGVELANSLVKTGEPELGAAALTAFGRRLGEALRRDGRPREAIDMLRSALAGTPGGELSRALLLEELGLNAALTGRISDAVGAWLDAADVAHACGNTAVATRLERRIAGDRR
jgi:serine/threonine protein kinase